MCAGEKTAHEKEEKNKNKQSNGFEPLYSSYKKEREHRSN